MPRPRDAQRRETHPGRPSLLVLRGGGLARFLSGVPAYRALRRAFPRHHMVIATSGWLRPLVGLTDALDELLPATVRPGVLAWSGPSPDVAVNLHDRGPDSHLLLHTLWPARMIAFASPAAPDGLEGPAWRDDEPEAARWCRLLESFGIATDADDLRLSPPSSPSRAPGAVVVHTGTPHRTVPWPVRHYAEVIRALRAAGHQVVVTGWGIRGARAEQDEAPDEPEVIGTDDSPAGYVADLGALAALVAESPLLVCGDPEVAELGTAYGTPSLVVRGAVAHLRADDEVADVLARAKRILGAGANVVSLPPAPRTRGRHLRPVAPAAPGRGTRPAG